jgi:hypothetical protein
MPCSGSALPLPVGDIRHSLPIVYILRYATEIGCRVIDGIADGFVGRSESLQ